ncbi:MAG: DUF1559 domain-containing protein [Planctomycetaceae bacterium]|nr:DUF1559 domain-containing protein [Planctomycetaceae bacterium]
MAFALHKYNEKHGHLPPAVVYKDGVAMHSWRVLILEFTAPDLFSQYRMSEPWNSPHNSRLAGKMPRMFYCTSMATIYRKDRLPMLQPSGQIPCFEQMPTNQDGWKRHPKMRLC